MHRQGIILTAAAVATAAFFPAFALPADAQRVGAFTAESGRPGSEAALFQEIPSVYTASKFEQKATEAPAFVSIVTADEIRKYGYRTLGDILRSVAGFSTTYDRNYLRAGARGFSRPGDYNSRFLLLVDGIRINDPLYDSAYLGTDFSVDIDLIDRVEIIRGPASSLYGTSAVFGVVNVFTKRGRDYRGMEASAAAGSDTTVHGRLTYGDRFPVSGEPMLSGSYYGSKGQDHLYYPEFDTPDTNNGIAEDLDYDRSKTVFGKYFFRDFVLEGFAIDRKKGVPTASYGTIFNDSSTATEDKQLNVDLKYEHGFPGSGSVMTRVTYIAHHYSGDYAYAGPGGLVKDYGKGEGWEWQFQAQRTFFERHRFLAGAEYRDLFRLDQGTYDATTVYLDDQRRSSTGAVFLQDEFSPGKGVIVNAGVRYDYYESFGSSTNPRVAVIYNPIEKTTLKFLYGSAFRAPNAYELYYNDNYVTQKPSPGLEPETITTYEVVYDQYLGDHVHCTASYFYYTMKNLISLMTVPNDTTPDPADTVLVFENLDAVETRGVEFELEGKWQSGLSGRVSYTHQGANDKATGALLPNSPRNLFKANLALPLVEDVLYLGIENQYVSGRGTLGGAVAAGYGLTNLTLFSQNLVKGLEASASVYNVFDRHYHDPGAPEHTQDTIEQDGRTFRVKLTYLF